MRCVYIAAGGAACAQAVVGAGGAVATVAALRVHVGNVGVQANGCTLLGRIAEGSAACAQTVMEAGGAVATVAALRAHVGNRDVQRKGCAVLVLIAKGGAACAQAVAAAGGAAAAAAASAEHPRCEKIQYWVESLNSLFEDARAAADVAMEALLLEVEAEREANSRKKPTKAKKVNLKSVPRPTSLAESSLAPAPLDVRAGGVSDQLEELTAQARVQADEALGQAALGGDCDALSHALETHRGAASEAAVQEARMVRDKLAKARKKESQRLRKAHAGAMSALPQLQVLGEGGNAEALREGLQSAASHAGVLPALDEELDVARARLEELAIEGGAAIVEASGQAVELTFDDLAGASQRFLLRWLIPCLHSFCTSHSISLHLLQHLFPTTPAPLTAATEGFAEAKKIGSGGFGRVYAATADRLPISALAQSTPLKLKACLRLSFSCLQCSLSQVQPLRSCAPLLQS